MARALRRAGYRAVTLPDPLTPTECDLRHYKGMTIEIARLQRSKAWKLCRRRPELAFYMLNLWLASWHEVPAASLENDDESLCDLAQCDPERWPEVRGDVLRGWEECGDGRLYHATVAEVAIEALSKSRKARASADARWKNQGSGSERKANGMRSHSEGNAKKERRKEGRDSSSLRSEESDSSLRSESSGRKKRAGAQGARIQGDWTPSAEDRAFARAEGLPSQAIDREAGRFRDFWIAKTGASATKKDWPATWRNWIRKARDQQHGNGYRAAGGAAPGETGAGGRFASASKTDAARRVIDRLQRAGFDDDPDAIDFGAADDGGVDGASICAAGRR